MCDDSAETIICQIETKYTVTAFIAGIRCMEVVNPRAALLSNFEVLTLLRDLESDHLARTKTALRVKKEEETAGHAPRSSGGEPFGEASENLRTIEIEAIQYLSSDYLPHHSQTAAGITKLVKDLAPYELTKAEKLQVVNLAPTLPVELYVIVEELEDRLGDRMEDILSDVKSSLTSSPVQITSNEIHPDNFSFHGPENHTVHADTDEEVYIQEEIVFDDMGEGAGVEGDLDMDDD